jgi:hypothetical protein
MPHRSLRTFATVLLLIACASCSRRSPEPEGHAPKQAERSEEPSLAWRAPASWTLEKSAEKGLYRAKYIVPAQGNAPNPAEVLVTRLGRGDAAGLSAPLDELQKDFEGEASRSPVRREREARGFALRELEIAGTYKFPMGPKVGKRPVAQVMKEGWRAIGVGVRAPNGELWFFRLVGPDDAVQAARSPFLAMLEGLEMSGEPTRSSSTGGT